MSNSRRAGGKSDRVLGLLVGSVGGMLFSCCLGMAGLLFLERAPLVTNPTLPSAPPAAYDIEAIVDEDYINRTMVENASWVPSPVPVVAGQMDIRPGGQADFTVQVEIGPLQPVFSGTAALNATEQGELEIEIIAIRAGYIPVTPFVPAGQMDGVNQAINQLLAARTGATGIGLRMVGVTSDETSFHFYLIAVP